jgi:hypothetical protein
MSTPLQRIQLGLLFASLNPGGMVLVILLLLFVPFAVIGLLYNSVRTVKDYFQASSSAIVSEVEAKGAGDLWQQLAPSELGQWFYERPALAAHIARECRARKVENKGWAWDASPEERVCYSAGHPLPYGLPKERSR